MLTSPQQERINELCAKAIATNDPLEFSRVVSELRAALRAQLTYLKDMVDDAKQTIGQLRPSLPIERRKVERRKMERRRTKYKQAKGSAE